MKQIQCAKPFELLIREAPLPEITQGNQVLIKIKKVGVCGTDFHAFAGNQAFLSYPRVLGHELAAEVVNIGNEVENVKKGDKVTAIPYLNCNQCRACQNKKTNCCKELQTLGVHVDGGMQEYFVLPASNLLPVNELSFLEVAIIEPLSIGVHAVRRGMVKKEHTVVVSGCGPIGAGIIAEAKITGARIIVLDTAEDRMKFAKEVLGADHVMQPGPNDANIIADITDNSMADVVFDATGSQTAIQKGIEFVGHGGKFVLVGLYKDNLTFHHPSIHAKEATIMSSRNATELDFNKTIDNLRQELFPVDSYITHKSTYLNAPTEFRNWHLRPTGLMKAVLEF